MTTGIRKGPALASTMLATLAVLSAPGTTPSEAGAKFQKVCKEWISASAQAPLKSMADLSARSTWSMRAQMAYGPHFGYFANAQVGTFLCNKVGSKFSCTVRARPCGPAGLERKG